jgi:hypothetical protein
LFLPILKEFDMDIPYVNGNKEDYEKIWKEKRIKFRDEIRCICSLYEQNFEKLRTVDCWKLLIECVKEITDNRIRCYDGVCQANVQLDIDWYFGLTNIEKKKLILSLLKQGVDKIIEEKKWDKQPFEIAYQKIIAGEYINHLIWNKPKKNPDKKYSAEVICDHDIDEFSVRIIIRNKNGDEVKQKKIITERPNEWAFAKHFGRLEWLSQNEVALINKDETDQWKVQF